MQHAFAGLIIAVVLASQTGAGTLAQFRTVIGDVEVELFDADKPVTVRNFINLVRAGAYANTFFHRCEPGFVVQGGGFRIANPASEDVFAEYLYVPHFGRITNEYSVGRQISNTAGTIAMARVGGETNSATSQFFFNLADNGGPHPSLDTADGGFTVFGNVVRGLEILGAFNGLAPNNGLIDLRKIYGTNSTTQVFAELPVRYAGSAAPRYVDLVYVDVTLLGVRVQRTNGLARVSWNSVKDRPNVVEFTATMPPAWQTLVNTNGTGELMAVEDNEQTEQNRFYRVRVE